MPRLYWQHSCDRWWVNLYTRTKLWIHFVFHSIVRSADRHNQLPVKFDKRPTNRTIIQALLSFRHFGIKIENYPVCSHINDNESNQWMISTQQNRNFDLNVWYFQQSTNAGENRIGESVVAVTLGRINNNDTFRRAGKTTRFITSRRFENRYAKGIHLQRRSTIVLMMAKHGNLMNFSEDTISCKETGIFTDQKSRLRCTI